MLPPLLLALLLLMLILLPLLLMRSCHSSTAAGRTGERASAPANVRHQRQRVRGQQPRTVLLKPAV